MKPKGTGLPDVQRESVLFIIIVVVIVILTVTITRMVNDTGTIHNL